MSIIKDLERRRDDLREKRARIISNFDSWKDRSAVMERVKGLSTEIYETQEEINYWVSNNR